MSLEIGGLTTGDVAILKRRFFDLDAYGFFVIRIGRRQAAAHGASPIGSIRAVVEHHTYR